MADFKFRGQNILVDTITESRKNELIAEILKYRGELGGGDDSEPLDGDDVDALSKKLKLEKAEKSFVNFHEGNW